MESRSKLIAIACCSAGVALLLAQPAWSQRAVFSGVQIRFSKSGKDRKLIESSGSLIFDDTLRKLIVKSSEKPLELGYDDVTQVVFDKTRHVRGASPKKHIGLGTLTNIVKEGGPLGQVIGGAADAGLEARREMAVTDYWMQIEIKMPGGSIRPALLEISKDDSDRVMAKAQMLFGNNVHITDFPELGKDIEKKTLKDASTKHTVKVDRINHPDPQIRPDKALIVVACPNVPVTGSSRGQFKLHAGDSVIAVNEPGTYTFAYLDPGEYEIVSQAGYLAGNANGFKMKLEAGGDYYFFQNVVTGGLGYKTVLSRNAKEIVMYEVQGSYYSDWKRKTP